jgi:addiction module HigA family antidote
MPIQFDPPHPGEFILETIEGLREEGQHLTIEEVAKGLGTSRKNLSLIIHKRQGISPEMALRLAAAFRNTTAEFWLQAQEHYDLAAARKVVKTDNVRVFWEPKVAA